MRFSLVFLIYAFAAIRNVQMSLETARPLTYSGIEQY